MHRMAVSPPAGGVPARSTLEYHDKRKTKRKHWNHMLHWATSMKQINKHVTAYGLEGIATLLTLSVASGKSSLILCRMTPLSKTNAQTSPLCIWCGKDSQYEDSSWSSWNATSFGEEKDRTEWIQQRRWLCGLPGNSGNPNLEFGMQFALSSKPSTLYL